MQKQITITIQDQPILVWPIPTYSGYAINEIGVFSNRKDKKNNEWYQMKTPTGSNGYKMVCLTDNLGNQKSYTFHKLLYCSAIEGQIITGTEFVVDHIDSDRSHNTLSNLQKITFSENVQKGCKTKHDKEIVEQIWNDFKANNLSVNELSEKYNIPYSLIHSVVNGKIWNSVTGLPKDKRSYQKWYKNVKAKRLQKKLDKLSEKFKEEAEALLNLINGGKSC